MPEGVELPPPRAKYFFKKCADLRAGKGVTKKALAQDSGLDRSTLDKIERQEGVTQESVMRVFNRLNDGYFGGKLRVDEHVESRGSK